MNMFIKRKPIPSDLFPIGRYRSELEQEFTLWKQTSEYCMESSLHGLRFIGQPSRHIVERIFWLIAFVASVTVATIWILEIWDKYRRTPVITVFQPLETTINLIPFPAVTICNTNNVIKSKADEFINRVKENPDDPNANHDLYLLNHICQTSTTFSETFNFSLERGAVQNDILDQVLQFKHTNHNKTSGRHSDKSITQLLGEVTQRCSSMILLCMWGNDIQNCSDLFDEIETDFGYCCVFNMVPVSLLMKLRNDSRDKEFHVEEWDALKLNSDNLILDDEIWIENEYSLKYGTQPRFPYRQRYPGKTTGLSVLLDPDLKSYFCANTDSAGFMALTHSNLEFPYVTDRGIPIKSNTVTYLKVDPDIIVAGDEIKGFPLEKRKCYFANEFTLKYFNYYTISNCENECIANITFERCGCIRYFMPRAESQKICGVDKYNCSERVRKSLLQQGLQKRCNMCRPSCIDVGYHMTSSYMPMRTDIPLWEYPNGTNASWAGGSVTILHVHFSSDSTYAKQRKELYGFIDLLSNTGGLLGLCMGFSVLSVLEIIYFATLRLYCQARNGRRIGQKLNLLVGKIWQKIVDCVKPRDMSNVTTFQFYESNVQNYGYRGAGNKSLKGVSVIKSGNEKLAKLGTNNMFYW